MNTLRKKRLPLILMIAGLVLMPLSAFAQSGSAVAIPNPISCGNLICLFVNLMRLILAGLGVFGMVMFIWGGFLMLTSAGNADRIQKGKETLVWSILGILVILGSWILLKSVIDAINGVTN
ncbi:MAG: hypothetical protein H6760_04655 [Candidatus Nomurabacteria bacterium]|nr:MAG: hypothetical protein H6760_04655 [Candidatus Nomurabacteria bacterium]